MEGPGIWSLGRILQWLPPLMISNETGDSGSETGEKRSL
jgi:hypothetical protein